jgi:hypothetical protein
MLGQHVADVNILDQKMTHRHLTSAAKFFIQQLQQLGMQIFVPMAFKMQCRAMDKGDIQIPNQTLEWALTGYSRLIVCCHYFEFMEKNIC